MEKLGAVVLCGGQSKRMGKPKLWLPIENEVFLQRIVHLLKTRTDLVIVSAAEAQSLPELPSNVEILRDPVPDKGPLQGIAIAMQALAGRASWAFACATDTPLLQPRWIDRLQSLVTSKHEMILPRVEGRSQPLAALYRPEVAALAASKLLKTDQTKLGLLSRILRTRIVVAEELMDVDPEFLTLWNVNSPNDYTALIQKFLTFSSLDSFEPGVEMDKGPSNNPTK